MEEEAEVKVKKKSKEEKNGEKPGYCDCCSLRYKDLKKVNKIYLLFILELSVDHNCFCLS